MFRGSIKPELRIRLPAQTDIVPLLITHPRNQPIFTIDVRYEDRYQRPLIVRVSTSDKGEYLRGLIRVFGNFWTAKEFCDRRFWRRMFAKLANYDARNDVQLQQEVANLLRKRLQANDDPEHLARRVLGLVRGQSKRSIALPYSAFKTELDEVAKVPMPAVLKYPQGDTMVHDHSVKHLTDEEMNQGLTDLVELNVLRPGVYVRCSYCGLRPWYHVDDLKQQVRCPGCGHSQSMGGQQEWCYALNSLAEMSVIQGQLSVMQALGALASNSLESFFYSPSLDLFQAESTDHWHEIDVAAVAVGEFTIGEVKGGERGITQNDFSELAEIRPQRAIIFLPHENISSDVVKWLGETAGELLPLGIKAQIYALPSF